MSHYLAKTLDKLWIKFSKANKRLYIAYKPELWLLFNQFNFSSFFLFDKNYIVIELCLIFMSKILFKFNKKIILSKLVYDI